MAATFSSQDQGVFITGEIVCRGLLEGRIECEMSKFTLFLVRYILLVIDYKTRKVETHRQGIMAIEA